MGNTNGKSYYQSTRQPIESAVDSSTNEATRRTVTETFLDEKTLTPVPVTLTKIIPKGFQGYPVHEMSLLNTTDSYTTVSLEHPDRDAWYMATIPPYLDNSTQGPLLAATYTYLIQQTGYSVLNGSIPIFPYEIGNGVFLSGVDYTYPRVVIRPTANLDVYTYSAEFDDLSKITRTLDFRGSDKRMYDFYMARVQDITSDPHTQAYFMAQFHSYVYFVTYCSDLIGYNPFPPCELTTKLSYPYLLVADLTMYDIFYSIPAEFQVLMGEAMSFVRLWSRTIWSVGASSEFQYGYLDEYYIKAASRLGNKAYQISGQEFSMLRSIYSVRLLGTTTNAV